ncbi:hypothetical protein MiSe_31170 [Microseira wollei NIES-4236]|uniref:Uncharacterized protein n=2 Tax=Microseira wollei TaxID=467598 RepID=A0AAV3XAE5_9CYAN|nr:hypothetical protein MiSe_31170 [Microseira wollei NIES-4236]
MQAQPKDIQRYVTPNGTIPFIKQNEKHKTPVVYAGDVVRPGLLSPVK